MIDFNEAIMIETSETNNLSFTKQITAKAVDDGEIAVLAELTANYSESAMMGGGPSLSFTLNLREVEIVENNVAQVQAEVDEFMADVRLKVGASMPITM